MCSVAVCSQEFFEAAPCLEYQLVLYRTYNWLKVNIPDDKWREVHGGFGFPISIVFHDEVDALLYKLMVQ